MHKEDESPMLNRKRKTPPTEILPISPDLYAGAEPTPENIDLTERVAGEIVRLTLFKLKEDPEKFKDNLDKANINSTEFLKASVISTHKEYPSTIKKVVTLFSMLHLSSRIPLDRITILFEWLRTVPADIGLEEHNSWLKRAFMVPHPTFKHNVRDQISVNSSESGQFMREQISEIFDPTKKIKNKNPKFARIQGERKLNDVQPPPLPRSLPINEAKPSREDIDLINKIAAETRKNIFLVKIRNPKELKDNLAKVNFSSTEFLKAFVICIHPECHLSLKGLAIFSMAGKACRLSVKILEVWFKWFRHPPSGIDPKEHVSWLKKAFCDRRHLVYNNTIWERVQNSTSKKDRFIKDQITEIRDLFETQNLAVTSSAPKNNISFFQTEEKELESKKSSKHTAPITDEEDLSIYYFDPPSTPFSLAGEEISNPTEQLNLDEIFPEIPISTPTTPQQSFSASSSVLSSSPDIFFNKRRKENETNKISTENTFQNRVQN